MHLELEAETPRMKILKLLLYPLQSINGYLQVLKNLLHNITRKLFCSHET